MERKIQRLYHNQDTCEIAVLGVVEHEDMTTSWFVEICKQFDADVSHEKNPSTEKKVFEHNETNEAVKQFLRDRNFYPLNTNIILVPKHVSKNFSGDIMFWDYVARVYGMESTSMLVYDREKIFNSYDIRSLTIPWKEHNWVWYEGYVDPVLDHFLRCASIEEAMSCDEMSERPHDDRDILIARIATFEGQRYLMHDNGLIEEI